MAYNNPSVFNKDRFNILGNTYPVKDKLKALGCKWDANNKVWYAMDLEVAKKANALTGNATPYFNAYTQEEKEELRAEYQASQKEAKAIAQELQTNLEAAKSELAQIGLTQQGIDRLISLYHASQKPFVPTLREVLSNAKYTDVAKKQQMFAILEKYDLLD